jgi:hypothetical protein
VKRKLTESEALWEMMLHGLRQCDGMEPEEAEAFLRTILRRRFDIPDLPAPKRGRGLYSWWSV